MVLLPFVFALRWQDWRLLLSSRVFLFLTLWIGVLTLSIVWSDPALRTSDAVYDTLRYAILILLFVAATAWVVASRDDWFSRVLFLLVPVATIVLIYSIAIYYAEHPFPSARLGNMIFYRESPNRGTVGFLLVALIGMTGALGRSSRIMKALGWAGLVVGLAFILLAQSRGLLLAFTVGAIIQLAYLRYWRLLLVLGISSMLAVVATDLLDLGVRSFLDRADAHRFVIWTAVLERIQESLWLGEGLVMDRSVAGADGRTYYSPHNIWLMSTLVAGLFGLVSLILVVLAAMRESFLQCRMHEREPSSVAVLGLSTVVAGLVLLSFDGHEIIDQANPHLWLGLWFPLGVLTGYEVRRRQLYVSTPPRETP